MNELELAPHCNHDWQVVIEAKYMPWDDFMAFRGDEKDLNNLAISRMLTHTLICHKCCSIKQIETSKTK